MAERARVNVAWQTLAGVAAVSFVQLGFELLFIKLSHYEFGVLSLAVIGVAMLGVSLGALLTTVTRGLERATDHALVALPLSALLAGVVFFANEFRPRDVPSTLALLAATGVVCLTTLALATVPVYASIRAAPRGVHELYAASLVGGALGAPVTLGVVHLCGDLFAYVALVGCVAVSVTLLCRKRVKRLGVGVALATTVVAAVVLPMIDRAAHPDSIYSETNGVSRIDVKHAAGHDLLVRTGGIAGTFMPSVDPSHHAWMFEGLDALPFKLRPKRVLVLGSGAGKNVAQALEFGAEQVVAVEINGMIPGYMRRALPLSEDPYRDRRVSLLVGEGRETAARFALSRERGAPGFDLIYVPVATSFGNPGMTFVESYLMTRQAIETYYAALAPNGVVAIYFLSVPEAKILTAMVAAFADHALDPTERVLAFTEADRLVVLSRPHGRFSSKERALLLAEPPKVDVVNVENELALHAPRIALEDDNPFLYNEVSKRIGSQVKLDYVPAFLDGLLLAFSAALALGVALLVSAAPSRARLQGLGIAASFTAMGAGYTIVQTGLIQRLTFLFGHPVAGVAIVLPSTLVATGMGSWVSRRWTHDRYALRRGASTLLLIACIVAIACVEPRLLIRPSWPWVARAAAATTAGATPFVVMGTFFPVIFERVERHEPALAVHCWLVNGVASVVGSVLAIGGAQQFGFRTTLLWGAVSYALLAVWDVLSARVGQNSS